MPDDSVRGPGDPSAGAPSVPLDLVRREIVVPKLRRISLISIAVGLLITMLVSLFAPFWAAVLIGVVIGGPPALGSHLAGRRAYWLAGRTVSARMLATRTVDIGGLTRAELVVQPGRFRQVHLALADRDNAISVPLALYGADRGAELDIMGIRRLADVLAMSELISAEIVSRVLVEHLRAEARGAGLTARPLFRAVTRAEETAPSSRVALSEDDLALILDAE
ncbi:hypothetical protein HT102_02245 [Hoyosella sp. G463]|uniref:Uncharacterized protein n=1 Tax=Lolliginicoccus lacisalsi TaxID=2742202 RepID=A0A927PLF1_9ACTN|nr:hypothetical protein [Lolliginicoccus lacisalsi]MBD8505312.1 hypothetical protein [Lolliginicoccus lacisalsi]